MTFQDSTDWAYARPRPEQQGDPAMDPVALQWVDQLAQEMLLTVQAFLRLQAASDKKFI